MEDYKEEFKGKNILITGGLGFIGSNLARKLIDLNPSKITIVDSLIKNLGGNLENVSDISNFIDIPNITNGGVDISDTKKMSNLLIGVDYIFNLAGSVSHLNSKNRPLEDLNLNLRDHISLLENCKEYAKNKKGDKLKVLFSATRDIYGKVKEENLPVKEDFLIGEHTDPQGIHKQASEFYHLWYGANFGFDTTSLRLTNTYGPRQKIEDQNLGFLGYFIHQALKNETIRLWGGGKSWRDFNYIDDVTEAMLMTMATSKTNNEIYNLGSYMRINGKYEDIGKNIRSVGESARIITEIARSGLYEEIPYPEERKSIEPGHIYLDATKIYEHTGWKPKVSFEEGIKKTIEYYLNKGDYKK